MVMADESAGYVPNTNPNAEHRDGKAVMPDGALAPKLWVQMHCPYTYPRDGGSCDGDCVVDAYRGPVRCEGTPGRPHSPTFMCAVKLEFPYAAV